MCTGRMPLLSFSSSPVSGQRGRMSTVGDGLGVALGATVLLFPVVQPWYLLWAIIPLAAWATRPRFRIAVI